MRAGAALCRMVAQDVRRRMAAGEKHPLLLSHSEATARVATAYHLATGVEQTPEAVGKAQDELMADCANDAEGYVKYCEKLADLVDGLKP